MGIQAAQLLIDVDARTGEAEVRLAHLDGSIRMVGAESARRASDGITNMSDVSSAGVNRMVRSFNGLNQSMMMAGQPLGPLQQGINGVTMALSQSLNYGSRLAGTLTGIGAGLTAVGAVGLAAAMPLQRAHATLAQAIRNTGNEIDDYKGKIDALVKRQEHLGNTQADTEQALARLVVGTKDPKRALELMGEAADLAAFKHISLTQATKELIRINAGYGRGLKLLGIEMNMTHGAQRSLEAATRQHERAMESAARAQERLDEANQIAAAHGLNHAKTIDHMTAAQERLTAAQQHQADVAARQAGASGGGDDWEVRHAKDLEAAQRRVADALALRSKYAAHTAGEDRTLADAQRHLTLVTDAHPKSSNAALNAEITRRQSQERLDAATRGLTRAQQLQNLATDRASAPSFALKHAQEALDTANRNVADSTAKINRAQADLNAESVQGATALGEIHKRLNGIAEAQAHTFAGTIARIKAEVTDATAHFGQHAAKWLVAFGPALAGIGGLMESGLIGKIGKSIVGIGRLTMEFGGFIAKASAGMMTLLEANPIILAITVAVLALAAIGYVIYKNWDDIKRYFFDTWHWLHDTVVEVFGKIEAFFRRWGPLILELLTGPIGIAVIEFIKHWDQIKNGAIDAFHSVVDFFTDLPATIFNAVFAGIRDMVDLGGHIVRGIWNGIASRGSWLWDKIKGFVEDYIKSPLKAAMHIFSPSQVTHEYGQYIAQGLARGILAGGDEVEAATRLLLTKVPGKQMSSTFNMGVMAATPYVPSGGQSTGTLSSNDLRALIEELRALRREKRELKLENHFHDRQDPMLLSKALAREIAIA